MRVTNEHITLTETCATAAKRPCVRPRLEGEMPKTVSFGRNVQLPQKSVPVDGFLLLFAFYYKQLENKNCVQKSAALQAV